LQGTRCTWYKTASVGITKEIEEGVELLYLPPKPGHPVKVDNPSSLWVKYLKEEERNE